MKKIFSSLVALLVAFSLTLSIYSDSTNIAGGSGTTGEGSNYNGWVVQNESGGYIYDAEGLRIYVVDGETGAPVSNKTIIDVTNADFKHKKRSFSRKKYPFL